MLFEDARLGSLRLFKAYEINEHGERVEGSKKVAIKDYWLDTSREAEPIILKKVLEAQTKL